MTDDTLRVAHMRDWDIIVDPAATPAECYAAEELGRWFGLATGVELPICYYVPEVGGHVYVGRDVWPAPACRRSTLGTGAQGRVQHRRGEGPLSPSPATGCAARSMASTSSWRTRWGCASSPTITPMCPMQATAEISCGRGDYKPPFASLRWSAYYRER